jgi:hypothetical protein
MLSGTWILCFRLFSYPDVPVYPCTTWLPLIEILWQLGWLIFLCKLCMVTSWSVGETSFSLRLTLTSLKRECIHKLTGPTSAPPSNAKPHLDLFCQEKYLLNHVDLKIKLRRNRDVFALITDVDNYKIKIKDLLLFVRNVQLIPAWEWDMSKLWKRPAVNTPSDV